jgi:hypothetical protein
MLAEVTTKWPCPCCGHLTLPEGPGDYGVCPVCFWEDSGTQLRWPMNPDGPNGISLIDAQKVYERIGTVDKAFRRKVRRSRRDEPLDPGWRMFDPERDWTDPTLPGKRWPKNREALYYWRSTYWNGDPDRLPAPPTEPTGGDRLVAQLQRDVPETRPTIESVEWQYGIAAPMRVCGLAAEVAIEAYRSGKPDLGLRIATVLTHGLDESSELHAPNSVAIGFLENHAWHEPAMQPFIDAWPQELRAEILEQQASTAQRETEIDQQATALSDLWSTSSGRPVGLLEEQLKGFEFYDPGSDRGELSIRLTARIMSDQRWVYKHPLAALKIAWRYRRAQSPLRTLRWLCRPRFAG